MNILKELQHIYKFNSLNELSRFLKIPPRTVYGWNSTGNIPNHTRNLLLIIYKQKERILDLENCLF